MLIVSRLLIRLSGSDASTSAFHYHFDRHQDGTFILPLGKLSGLNTTTIGLDRCPFFRRLLLESFKTCYQQPFFDGSNRLEHAKSGGGKQGWKAPCLLPSYCITRLTIKQLQSCPAFGSDCLQKENRLQSKWSHDQADVLRGVITMFQSFFATP